MGPEASELRQLHDSDFLISVSLEYTDADLSSVLQIIVEVSGRAYL